MNKYLHWPNRGRLKVLGFASGSGNSLWKALELQGELDKTYEGCPFEIVGLFSDNPNSKAVEYANKIGLPCVSHNLKEFHSSRNKPLSDLETRAEFDREVYGLIKHLNADIIFLAGYVWATTEAIVDNFTIVNIHPADLSIYKDGTRAYAGANGVGATLEAGELTISSSAHIATKEIDGGPLLFLSPKTTIDYSLYDNMQDLKKHYLKIVNEQSRLLGARTLLEIAEGNISVNENGVVCYKGKTMPEGIRIKAWSENKPRHERDISKLIAPKSIAVIGASAKGGIGKAILSNIINSGFKGEVYAVNRSGEDVLGVKAYKSIIDISGDIDLGIITLPSISVLEVVNECGQRGVKDIVCISAGFKETGDAGAKNEEKLKGILDEYNMRMIGPNCMGVLNTRAEINLNATMLQHSPSKGNVAFITQSGALGAALLDYANDLGLGFSIIVSLGNQTDINVNDMLPLLAQDESTEVIMLYLEAITEPHRFLNIAQKVAKKKLIIVIKSGRSESGAKAASSHTGSIAGSDTAMGALLKKAGVIRVDTLEDAYYLSLALSKMPPMKGNRVGVVTNAGGPGILVADRLSRNGLEMPILKDKIRQELGQKLFPESSTGNPIDLVAAAAPQHYALAVDTMLRSNEYDALLVVCVPPATIDTGAVAKAITEQLHDTNIPVLCCFLGPTLGKPAREVMKLAGVPCMEYPEKLADILKLMKTIEPILDEEKLVEVKSEIKHSARNIIKAYKAGEYLSAVDCYRLISHYGFLSPKYKLVTSPRELGELELKYPVVAKIEHPEIIHKSDVGGVVLGINNFEKLVEQVSILFSKFPGATGVILQEQCSVTTEIILGGKLERGIGHVALVGYGGTSVEIYKDVSLGFVPIQKSETERMIQDLKCYPLLKGYRGAKGINLEKLGAYLVKLSQMLMDIPEISEIDLNPIIYDAIEDNYKVLDCRIKI